MMQADFPNIKHLQVFCEVVRLGSMSLAADRLNMTQPAASQGIAKLETSLNELLLLRHSGGIQSTDFGSVFVKRANRAIGMLQQGAQIVQKAGGTANLITMITSAQLRALVAVGDTGSFTLAARQIGIAQPTVHRSARALEQAAGVALFRNAAVGIELTAAGLGLYQKAKLARAELRQGVEEVENLQGKGGARFVLGSLPLARSQIVPDAINRMIQEAQDVQIRVIDGRYSELLRGLREGDIDCLIGALRDPNPTEDVIQEPLFEDHVVVVCGPNHPLARRAQVSLADTLSFPWIASPRSTPSGQVLFEALDIESRLQTPVRVVSSSLVITRGLLAQGDYVSIISRHQIEQDLRKGELVNLPIPLNRSGRTIGLTTRRKWHPTPLQRRFIELLADSAPNFAPKA